MRRTAIFKDPLFLEHDPGYGHPESANRLRVIYEQLDIPEIAEKFIFPPFEPAPTSIINLNHTPTHVARVAATAGEPYDSLDPDTHTSAKSYAAACLAVGALVAGCRMIMTEEIDNCFALVRPPGHHAEMDHSKGFCLFNNIAIAARYCMAEYALERIFIMDWDLHHGNGTQHAFYDTSKVLYFSTHQYPYYPGSGSLYETGTGEGEGYTVNVPLRGGQGDQAYAAIFDELVVPIVRQYKPQIILVSAGYDIYLGDPLGLMGVTPTGFAHMTRVLVSLAEELCQGRILFTLEGGYNLQGMRDGTLATLMEMAGISKGDNGKLNSGNMEMNVLKTIEEVRVVAKKYWNL